LRVDRRLAESAALLHDVDKLEAVKPAVAGLEHALGAAEWLAARGYPELGPVIAGHPVTRLADGTWFEQWLATASVEALIVSYADKRAGQKLESMAARFASWERRYPPEVRSMRTRGSWDAQTLAAVRARAGEIERRVCEMAQTPAGKVERLAWTARAMRPAPRGLAA
jgi:hypothetical protein